MTAPIEARHREAARAVMLDSVDAPRPLADRLAQLLADTEARVRRDATATCNLYAQPQRMRLHCGELTAVELRVGQAVLKLAASAINEGMRPESQAEAGGAGLTCVASVHERLGACDACKPKCVDCHETWTLHTKDDRCLGGTGYYRATEACRVCGERSERGAGTCAPCERAINEPAPTPAARRSVTREDIERARDVVLTPRIYPRLPCGHFGDYGAVVERVAAEIAEARTAIADTEARVRSEDVEKLASIEVANGCKYGGRSSEVTVVRECRNAILALVTQETSPGGALES